MLNRSKHLRVAKKSQLTRSFWCLLCVASLAFSGCSKRADSTGTQILRISQRNEPASLDPHLATLPDEFFVIRALSEGLLTPSPEGGAPVPAVAESWSASADGLTYTFKLRADATWSNGDHVTAGDFVYSVHRALSPSLAAPKASLFFPIKNAEAFYTGRMRDFSAVGVHALNDRTLEFVLNEPVADFPAIVASGPWIPVHSATIENAGRMDQRGTRWTAPENFVGNGAFKLSAWRPNRDIELKPNPKYHSATRVKLEEIRLLAYDNGDSEERAFRSGQLDVTMAAPAAKISTYRAQEPSPLRTVPLHEIRYISLNTSRPPLDDRRVRRALSLALNRRALVEHVLQGNQEPAFNFVHHGLGGYLPSEKISEDTETARRLLREAGFPEGRGFPKLELTTWGVAPAQLEAIQQMWWSELKITVTIAQREASTHLAALAAGDYTLAFMTAIPDYDGASNLFSEFKTGHHGNYPRWSNADYDRLVSEATRESAPVKRTTTYQAAERLLLGDMPVIPLYFNTQNFLVQPNVQNWRADRLWTRFYQDVSLK
ncbi:peptide ABC transporter substrate-binding protein [Oleiharenicola lentus]|uniref:peptide ABC transporter substrate-binding protein n=1 Tax=Oleiharenicola lentus TaxID=2508720 RepID=UPI003F67F13A